MQYRLCVCAAAAHALKCRSCFADRGASGTPPPTGGEGACRPNGGAMWASLPTEVGRSSPVGQGWTHGPTPYNVLSIEFCKAGLACPANFPPPKKRTEARASVRLHMLRKINYPCMRSQNARTRAVASSSPSTWIIPCRSGVFSRPVSAKRTKDDTSAMEPL